MPCFSCAVSTTVPLESRVTDYICLPLPFGWPYLYFARLFINTVFCLFRCLIPIIAVLFFWIATCEVLRNLIYTLVIRTPYQTLILESGPQVKLFYYSTLILLHTFISLIEDLLLGVSVVAIGGVVKPKC